MGSLEAVIQSLPVQLARIGSKNPGLSERENKAIDKIRAYMIDFYTQKIRVLKLENLTKNPIKSGDAETSGYTQEISDNTSEMNKGDRG
jgi:hypothetical protein